MKNLSSYIILIMWANHIESVAETFALGHCRYGLLLYTIYS